MKKTFIAILALLPAMQPMMAEDAADYRIAPYTSVPLNEISHVQIAFPQDVEMLIVYGGANVNIVCPDGSEKKIKTDWINYTAGQVAGIDLTPPLTDPGVYKFTIPTNNIYNEKDQYFLPPIEFSYTVVPPATDKFSIEPAPGAYSELKGSVKFNGKITADDPVAKATVKATVSAYSSGKTVEADILSDNGSYTFDLGDTPLTPDIYTVSLPEEFDNAVWNYTVVDNSYTITPAPGKVKSLWNIQVTFPGAMLIDAAGDPNDITLTSDSGNMENADLESGILFNWVTIINYNNIMPDGDYTLTIPAGTISVDGIPYMEPIVAKYTIDKNMSSINEIPDTEKTSAVYGIDGTLKADKADNESMSKLPKGIYITGGKKIIVR